MYQTRCSILLVYRELCDNLSGVCVYSSFNNILSNLGYVMLGLLFLLIVLQRDIVHKRALMRNNIAALVRARTHTHAVSLHI